MSGGQQSSDQQNQYAPQLNPAQLLQLYNQALPTTAATVGRTAGALDTGLASGTAAANPILTASGLQQLNTLAPGYQQAGANLATQQAQSTLGLLNGPGTQVANAAAGLNSALNPTQAAANTQGTNLINSINLNGLSGGEQSAVERSLNQSNYATGNLGLDNATNAVSNAMNFGNALQAKRTALGTALGVGTGIASAQNQQFNPLNTAIGAGSAAGNFGLGNFNPTQANTNSTIPTTFGSSIFGPLAANASASSGSGFGGSSGWNFGVSGGVGSGGSGASCYLTTVCCEWMGLPDNCEELTILRTFRDNVVPKSLTKEYYRVAPTIANNIRGRIEWLQYVWGVVQECVHDIKAVHNEQALSKYKSMVEKLQKEFPCQ